MKILAIHSQEPDYLYFMMCLGLQRLGVQVICQPLYKARFPFTSYTGELAEESPPEHDSEFDVCIFGYDVGEKVTPLDNSILRVLIDGRDSPYLLDDQIKVLQPDLIFKREYLYHRIYPSNCFPLPFASLFPVVDPLTERPVDVVFLANDNHPRRWRIHRILTQLGVHYVGAVSRNLPSWDEYMGLLARAKIGITVRGFGYDTIRFWECLASGCLLLAEETLQVVPNEFVDGKHLSYFDENTLPWLVGHYLYHEEKRQAIAKTGQQHLLNNHTVEARAQYMFDVIGKYR